MRRYSFISYLALFFAIENCGRAPSSAGEPGICPLSCSYSQIATTDMSIRLLHGDTIEIACQDVVTDTLYKNPIPIRFVVERKTGEASATENSSSSTGSGGTSSSSGAGADTKTDASSSNTMPASAISFEATILTGFMLDQPNPGDPSGQNKYKGILTSMNEWCTDACGVGAIDIVPLCKKKENVVTVLLRSGAIAKTITVKVKPPNIEL